MSNISTDTRTLSSVLSQTPIYFANIHLWLCFVAQASVASPLKDEAAQLNIVFEGRINTYLLEYCIWYVYVFASIHFWLYVVPHRHQQQALWRTRRRNSTAFTRRTYKRSAWRNSNTWTRDSYRTRWPWRTDFARKYVFVESWPISAFRMHVVLAKYTQLTLRVYWRHFKSLQSTTVLEVFAKDEREIRIGHADSEGQTSRERTCSSNQSWLLLVFPYWQYSANENDKCLVKE